MTAPRRLALALLAATVAACTVSATPTASPPTSSPTPTVVVGRLRVAFVSDVGGLDDHGFNALAVTGLAAARTELGIETAVVESRSADDYEPILGGFALQGYDLVISVGLLMSNATWRVAKRHPETRFALVDAAPTDDAGKVENLANVANVFFREQEAGYLVGMIAAEMLKAGAGRATSGTACALGALPVPAIDRYIAGYEEAMVRAGLPLPAVAYAGSYVDQARANRLGLAQIDAGCVALFDVAGSGGLGYVAAARERGVYAVGSETDLRDVAPDALLASAVKRVDNALLTLLRSLADGNFRSGDQVFGAKDDAVGYGTLHPDVPSAVRAAAGRALDDLRTGRVSPPESVRH